jgi:hypothetical protein
MESFIPFGASVTQDGQVVLHHAQIDDEHPPSQPVIDILAHGFRKQAKRGQIRAAGLCVDMRITRPGQIKKTDALCVSLEHQCGKAIDVFLPYERDSSGQIRYDELFAQARDRQFFEKN